MDERIQSDAASAPASERERVSHMMLFCALLLVKNSKATLEESVSLVPLVGGAKELAGELCASPVPPKSQ